MKRSPTWLLIAACFVAGLAAACTDENDPEYWLEKMHDRPYREESIKKLNELFNHAMQANKNELTAPAVKKVVDVMVPGLIDGYAKFNRDKANRAEIVKLLAQMGDPRSVETFMAGLDMEESQDVNMFTVAADALRRQAVESALPKLLATYDKLVQSREKRGLAPFTPDENQIAQSVISAIVQIVLKNPTSPNKGKVIEALCKIAVTPDTLQELRLNMRALKGLGQIGDPASIQTLIIGIALQGKVQKIGLGPFAFASLQQISDRDAVVDAIIRFAKGEDKEFKEYYKQEIKNDVVMKNPLWFLQQGVDFLGNLNYASPKAIEFLMAELNHNTVDEADKTAAGLQGLAVQYEAEGWAAIRRNWAAVALAQIGHKPIVDIIKSRLVFKKKGEIQELQIIPEEAVGYMRALGLIQYPEETCPFFLSVAKAGDDSLRDKTFYNASLMCGTPEFEAEIKSSRDKIDCDKVVAERFPDGAEADEEKAARNECEVLKNRLDGYLARVKFNAKCGKNLDCFLEAVKDIRNPNNEAAIYGAFRVGRDDPAKREQAVKAIAEKLDNPSMVALQANIYALDHLTPNGDKELLERAEKIQKDFARQSAYKDRGRLLEAFVGHVRARTSGGK